MCKNENQNLFKNNIYTGYQRIRCHLSAVAKGEGKFLFDIVMKPETFIQAMVLTEYGMPAVTSVAEVCYNEAKKRKGFKFTGRVKQFIGAMIALLMSANGYKKSGRKKSIIHRAYTRGEFYVKS